MLTAEDVPVGVRRLIAAVDGEDEDAGDDHALEEACELAHLARRQWEAALEQLHACRELSRRHLGLAEDGWEAWDDLPPGEARETAAGFRSFLRRVAASMIRRYDDVNYVAAELHAIVYGADAVAAPVTWQDYRTVLLGREGEPDFLDVRSAVDLLRSGSSPREVASRLHAISPATAERLSSFLGISEWRQESKLRAARAAYAQGLTAPAFREEYNARLCGADQIGERAARYYLARVRGEDAGLVAS